MISTLKRIRAHRRAHHKRQKSPLPEAQDVAAAASSSPEIRVPEIFLCPISLDLMRDPVILPSGVTYDRSSIDLWLQAGHSTCPVTNLPILNADLSDQIVPNHALRRTIQDWCVELGIDRIPTPRAPLTTADVAAILREFRSLAEAGDRAKCEQLLGKMRDLGSESDRNRRCIVDNGAGKALAAVFEAFSSREFGSNSNDGNVGFLEEILSAITETLPLDAEACERLEANSSLRCIVSFLEHGNETVNKNAFVILREIAVSASGRGGQRAVIDRLIGIDGSVVELLVKLVRDDHDGSTRIFNPDALKVLYCIASDEETRPLLLGIGLVYVLVEVLIDSSSNREVCEGALGVLDELFGSEQGKEEAYEASVLAVPVLVKKMLRVSETATALSVSAVWKLCKSNGDDGNGNGDGGGRRRSSVMVEALQVGAFQKLLLLLQIGCGDETKEKTSELLKWLNSCRDGFECIDSSDFKNLKRSFD